MKGYRPGRLGAVMVARLPGPRPAVSHVRSLADSVWVVESAFRTTTFWPAVTCSWAGAKAKSWIRTEWAEAGAAESPHVGAVTNTATAAITGTIRASTRTGSRAAGS